MSNLIQPLAEMLKFNNGIIMTVFHGLDEKHYYKRIEDKYINPICFQASHLTNSRFELAKNLGINTDTIVRKIQNPKQYEGAFDSAAAYDAGLLIKEDWDLITRKILALLEDITDVEALAKPVSKLPVPDQTARGVFMFYMWHESYHLGQMGAVRKYLGYIDTQNSFYEVMQEQKSSSLN